MTDSEKLAAATALLDDPRWTWTWEHWADWESRRQAFLAGQPAAPMPGTHGEYDCNGIRFDRPGFGRPAAPTPAQEHARLMQHKVSVISAIVEEARHRGGPLHSFLTRISDAINDAAPGPRQTAAPTRAEAEQRVLDAMAEADVDYLEMSAEHHSGWKEKLALAELARRGLK